jgi:hypothetical protein
MTPSQKNLYFRVWGRCAHARGWNTREGREADRAFFAAAPEVAQLHEELWAVAVAAGMQAGRTVAADDLRHACHLVAIGQDKSSTKLANPELDRILALFRLLADPDDLEAMIAWQNDQAGEVKRLVWALRQAPDAYVRAIASDKFGTKQWETLGAEELRQLALTVRVRMAAKRKHTAA